MNNSLDKLIGNDELLTYICLILAILNTLLMSMVINDTNCNFNIYIFLLFEALFLIFIVYFILKKKDVYSKDDDIKYDWYFYLRISIITLVFFNFALYIYNISNDSSTNPRKSGGGPVFSRNKVAPTNIENELRLNLLKQKLKSLLEEYKIGLGKVEKREMDVDSIAPLRLEMEDINEQIEKLLEKSTTATSRAAKTTRSRAASEKLREEASRTTSRASKELREEALRATRATSKDTNRVVPFPYQPPLNLTTPVPTTNPEIAKIFSSAELSAKQKIAKWSELNNKK